jgi:hypothetical protein
MVANQTDKGVLIVLKFFLILLFIIIATNRKNIEENVEFRDSPSISSKKPYKDIFAFACK